MGDQIGGKITFKGNNNSLKVQKNYFCNGAKQFVVKLEERIQKVNDAYNTSPSIENPRPVRKFQAAVDELDALYNECYEKCLKKDQPL